ncbi:MAG: DUF1800 domain-containing protein [Pseudomonadota bacterium]|nr:DUF1800 domain-containing protein [Pseudomonadota bacterium]
MSITRRAFLKVLGASPILGVAAGDYSFLHLLPGWPDPLIDSGNTLPPSTTEIDDISHVLARSSYGWRYKDYANVLRGSSSSEKAVEHYLERQLNPEDIDDRILARTLRRFEVLNEPIGELYEYKEGPLLQTLIRGALLRAVYSSRQLYEVMVQFWTDHFNIDSSKGECKWLKVADDRDVIRRHAMDSFPALLRASALSPAMLWYLDGRDNQKQIGADKPNENYARELLELHSLGVHGGYSQTDVMEVARCLTGWTVRERSQFFKGRVEFISARHDDGPKIILGNEIAPGGGAQDLDHVLEIVASHPATAQHIATKLCRRFISDTPPFSACVKVAATFQNSGGDIKSTLRSLFTTSEFFAAKGAKFRRPFEFVVGALRASNAKTDGGKFVIDYLDRMGHAPFQYPTPDGYSANAAPWLNTLLWRWNFSAALADNRIPGTVIDQRLLKANCGGDDGLMAAILGRLATADEKKAYTQAPNGLALLLASPAFQYS